MVQGDWVTTLEFVTKMVSERLCILDKRNPFFLDLFDPDETSPEPRKNCFCDACFYGRDRLALIAIHLAGMVDQNLTDDLRTFFTELDQNGKTDTKG